MQTLCDRIGYSIYVCILVYASTFMVPVPAGNLIHMWYLHMPIHSLHRKHSSLSGRFAHYALISNFFIGDYRRVKGKELLQELIFRKCIKIQTKLELL